MTEQSYRPRPGSVPWRVLQKFAILPPMSQQTVAELAQLCDVEPKHIKTLLAKCVDSEYLAATFNTEIGNAYKRGPQFLLWRNEAHELPKPEPTPEPEPPEPQPPSRAVPTNTPGIKNLLKIIVARHKTTPQRYKTSTHKLTNTLRVWRVA